MEAIVNAFVYIFLSGYVNAPVYNICESNLDHLTLEKKIDFSIGCCYVHGKRVYPDHVLQRILDDKV